MRSIYLDYNATTPVLEPIREGMLPFLGPHFGNPSSSHALGRASHEAIEDARLRVARLLGCQRPEVVFTSGGSESNNAVLKGVFLRPPGPPAGHLVISALEHPAVSEPARFLERFGVAVSVVPCDGRGIVDPQQVAAALRPDTRLVSVMLANNEIGTLQPIAEIAEICRGRGVWVHTDAAQAVGKVPVDVAALGVDFLSVAGHKLYAPKGVGALYLRQGITLEPWLHGAAHEAGRRAGTENTASIVALGHAAALAAADLDSEQPRLTKLRERLATRLRQTIGPGLVVHGNGAPRLPNTLAASFPGVGGDELLRACPEICASTTAACHGDTAHLSATQRALGLSAEVARGTIRLSLGRLTTSDEVDRAAEVLLAAWERLTPPPSGQETRDRATERPRG